MNQIIAIVGMCGVGKSVAIPILEEKGYQKVYFGGVTLQKMKEEGIAITPANEQKMRERIRSEYGMGAFALLLLPEIEEKLKKGNVVIDGLYSWDELKILKEKFGIRFHVIAVIADKMIRKNRLKLREIRPFTLEESDVRDISEIENLAKGGPIAYADYYINNNFDFSNYEQQLNKILKQIEG